MSIQDKHAPVSDKNKKRKKIRKKIVELLKNTTEAGERVYPNASVLPWAENELPCILVYTLSENASMYADAPKELERVLDVGVEIIAKGPEINSELGTPENNQKTLEDILDDIAEQVEIALNVDDSLGGLCDESVYTNAEMEYTSDGGQPIGSCRLTYSVTYYTHAPRSTDGQGADNDFGISDINYNIGENEDTREATDQVDQLT